MAAGSKGFTWTSTSFRRIGTTTEEIRLRDVLDLAGIPAPVVPVIPIGQQLAEKLHAFIRSYGNGSSRPRDLYDMLVVPEQLPVPTSTLALGDLLGDLTHSGTPIGPPNSPTRPRDWVEAWAGFVDVNGIPWTSLEKAGGALHAFWEHLLFVEITEAGDRDPDTWRWRPGDTQSLIRRDARCRGVIACT